MEACRAIEAEFPGCSAYYATPLTLSYGTPGFRAWPPGSRHARRPLCAGNPEDLREQLKALIKRRAELASGPPVVIGRTREASPRRRLAGTGTPPKFPLGPNPGASGIPRLSVLFELGSAHRLGVELDLNAPGAP